jgi:hypothetical protein
MQHHVHHLNKIDKISTNQQPSLLSQASWDRLDMKPREQKNRDKTWMKKRGVEKKGEKARKH